MFYHLKISFPFFSLLFSYCLASIDFFHKFFHTGYHISGDDVDNSFRLFGKNEWNALPDRLKNLDNVNIFKVNLKKYFLDGY